LPEFKNTLLKQLPDGGGIGTLTNASGRFSFGWE